MPEPDTQEGQLWRRWHHNVRSYLNAVLQHDSGWIYFGLPRSKVPEQVRVWYYKSSGLEMHFTCYHSTNGAFGVPGDVRLCISVACFSRTYPKTCQK